MNRIFKFRVWDLKQNKFWHDCDGITKHGIVLTSEGTPGLVGDVFDKYCPEKTVNYFSDEFLRIQQFIERLDRDGKEIYEGDIVEYIEKMFEHGDAQKLTGLVKYDDYFSAYGISKTEDGDCMNYFTDMTVDHFKVIGNIFENPELLTKNDNK